MKYEYSKAEMLLFISLNLDMQLLDFLIPLQIYNTLVKIAFMNNLQGPNVEALKRAITMLDDSGRRLTKEFDDIIKFHPKEKS